MQENLAGDSILLKQDRTITGKHSRLTKMKLKRMPGYFISFMFLVNNNRDTDSAKEKK